MDHMIVLNEKHLHRVLTSYFEYYHEARPNVFSPDEVFSRDRGHGTTNTLAGVGGCRMAPCERCKLLIVSETLGYNFGGN